MIICKKKIFGRLKPEIQGGKYHEKSKCDSGGRI
jgi:hypothetical protein